MPKPLIDESDPKLTRLNEILIDYLTKELPNVPGKRLVFADAMGILVSPISLLITIFKDILAFSIAVILTSVAHTSINELSSLQLTVIFFAVFVVLGKTFRSEISQGMLCFLNIVSCGFFIKSISRGYQKNSLLSHLLLRQTGPLFKRMGVYAESLPFRSRSAYHEFIEIYQRSRYGDEKEFDCLTDEYWKKEQST